MLRRVALVLCFAQAAGFSMPSGLTTKSFEHPKWSPLQAHLDELPAFTCTNQDGEPLGFEQNGKEVSVFFMDVDVAEAQLAGWREQYPELNLRLLGVGLGEALKRSIQGEAVIFPSQAAIEAAGEEWNPEEVPLYACLVMSKESRDGSGGMVTPFFCDPLDARENLAQAYEKIQKELGELDEDQKNALSLVVTSLPKAVELVLEGKEKETCGDDRFEFIPPSRSVAYLQSAAEELEKRKGERRAAAVQDAAPKPPDSGTPGGGGGGLFPE